MSQFGGGPSAPQTYTMRELNQRTAQVMQEISESGRPAAVTRHGRFIALITPLVSDESEAAALEGHLEAAADGGRLAGEHTPEGVETVEAYGDELGIHWRTRSD